MKGNKFSFSSLILIDLECGFPASIPNGEYKFLNGTRSFQSIVQYSCKEGFAIVGRSALSCDVDGRWNGPPPRCQPLECSRPVDIENGLVETSNNLTIVGTRAFYSCKPEYELEGDAVLICGKNGFWEGILPLCRGKCEKGVKLASFRFFGNIMQKGPLQ